MFIQNRWVELFFPHWSFQRVWGHPPRAVPCNAPLPGPCAMTLPPALHSKGPSHMRGDGFQVQPLPET